MMVPVDSDKKGKAEKKEKVLSSGAVIKIHGQPVEREFSSDLE